MQFANRIRGMRGMHWLVVFGLILLGWTVMLAMSASSDLRDMQGIYGAEFWQSLCRVTPDAAGLARLWLMWAAMSAAMMLPTFLPALATFDDLVQGGAAKAQAMLQLVAGYLIVWMVFSAFAAGAQLILTQAGVVTAIGTSGSRWFSAALLAVAGAYQFTTWKDACLSKCRAPLTFYMQYWDASRWNGLELGLRQGAYCLGCCWALMALAFVGGTMNLGWMGLATVLMVFEKLPDLGRVLTRPLGGILILAAALTAAGVL